MGASAPAGLDAVTGSGAGALAGGAVPDALLEMVGLVIMGGLLYRLRDKTGGDDAALYLQGKRVEEVLRQMRAELVSR